MAAPASYSFKDVVVLIDGAPISGYSDGDSAITVERSVDAFSQLVGADGDVMALKHADRSGVATLKLLQGSLSNTQLTSKLKLQDAGVLSPFPFSVKDTNGNDLVLAEAAYVVGPPRMVYGDGHNAREWKLILPAVDIFALGA